MHTSRVNYEGRKQRLLTVDLVVCNFDGVSLLFAHDLIQSVKEIARWSRNAHTLKCHLSSEHTGLTSGALMERIAW